MLNKEKYLDDIVKFAVINDSFAINKDTMEVTGCEDLVCSECLFFDKDKPMRDCSNVIIKFLDDEYVETPRLSATECTILENLDDKWKYIARDSDKTLYLFTGKPYITEWDDDKHMWDCKVEYDVAEFPYTNLFQFIQCKTEHCYVINELIKLYWDYVKQNSLGE